jgi:hypothetical protein
MADPTGPDEATVVRAVQMKRDGRTEREIADEFGVSASTAHSYVVKGHAHVRALGLANLAGEQADAAEQYQELIGRSLARLRNEHEDTDRTDAEFAAVAGVAGRLIAQRSRLLGSEAAQKLDIVNRDGGKVRDNDVVDRGLIAALERLEARDVADDREIRAGRPGVIERPV